MEAVKLACVFPGQGSQSVGMLDAWRGHRIIEDTIAEASETLGIDLWRLIGHGPAVALGNTVNTQPIVLATSMAYFRVFRSFWPEPPSWAAGHSLGEISALTAAGALNLAEALLLVRQRALAMSQAVAEGSAGMAAVLGLDDSVVASLCEACAQGEVLEPVNFNAPGQVVVAGHVGAIERIKVKGRMAGAKMVFVLPVSGPFHSSLMQPAARAFASQLLSVHVGEPHFAVLHNSRLEVARRESIKPALVEQMTRPVPWVQTIRRFAADGVMHIVEAGPGDVLTNLTRRIAPGIKAVSLRSPQAMEAFAESLLGSP